MKKYNYIYILASVTVFFELIRFYRDLIYIGIIKEGFSNNDAPCCKLPLNNNSAGKLTTAIMPNYSTLTTDNRRTATVYNSNACKPIQADFGKNIWANTYDAEINLFNKRYKPSGLYFMPKYPEKYSITGTFIDDGPLPANS